MNELLKKFLKNLKAYINYLMQVNFKDLFINTVILFCIIVLASLIYVPIGIVEDLIRSFIVIYFVFDGAASLLFSWIFSLISAICFIFTFMYLFNKRFDDLEKFKNQVAGKEVVIKKDKDKKSKKDDDDLDLPKTKA